MREVLRSGGEGWDRLFWGARPGLEQVWKHLREGGRESGPVSSPAWRGTTRSFVSEAAAGCGLRSPGS